MERVTYEEADRLAGVRVDRRVKQYWAAKDKKPCPTTGAILFKDSKFTAPCSGCSDDSEYSNSSIGSGCRECGGKGKSVQHFPEPYYFIKN